MAITSTSTVTRKDQREAARMMTTAGQRGLTTPAVGSLIAPTDRLFGFYDDGTVFDYGTFDTQAVSECLRRDGKTRSLEQVLTLPLRGASWRIDPPGADDGTDPTAPPPAQAPDPTASIDEITDGVRRNLGPKLPKIIDQMTTAIAYSRAYFECTWIMRGGQTYYDRIDFRPATGCEAGFDPATGLPRGFRQRMVAVGGYSGVLDVKGQYPGYRLVKPERAFVYTHGSYREPVMGVSDLDVSLWCWATKQKLLFLWYSFLEKQANPWVIAYDDDPEEADEIAKDIAELRNGGTLGLRRPGNGGKAFDVLEASGQGAAQFKDAITYLDSMQTSSVLAAFTDLPQAATQGTGSYALSADQSEFFLASRQAVADEMAEAITEGLIRPLVEYNYGAGTPCPRLVIGPLSNRSADRALTVLQSVIASPSSNAPPEFVDQLVLTTSSYLGLDEGVMRAAIEELGKRREEQQAQQAEMAKAQAENLGAAHAAMSTAAGAKDTAAQAALIKAKGMAGAKMGSARPGPRLPRPGGGSGAGRLSAATDIGVLAAKAKRAGINPNKAVAAVAGR